jgi:hypothetical protein
MIGPEVETARTPTVSSPASAADGGPIAPTGTLVLAGPVTSSLSQGQRRFSWVARRGTWQSAAVPEETSVARPVESALVEEATRKAGLVWLTYGDRARAYPAWHVWLDGVTYVVSGGEEQSLPDIESATVVIVTVPSKDTRGRLLSWVADADRVTSDQAEWPPVTAALAAGRLNATDMGHQAERWAVESVVTALTPTGRIIGSVETPDGDAHRAQPPPTTATTLGRQPYMLRGIRRSQRPPRG